MSAALETKLLSRMMTGQGMAEVIQAKLSPEVFEDPLHRAAFERLLAYQREHGMQPTMVVLAEEFPSVQIPHPNGVEEAAGWLVEELQRRYVVNEGQELYRRTAVMLYDDPVGTLRQVAQDAREIVERAGTNCKLDNEFLTTDQLDELEPPEPLIADVLSRHTYAILRGRDASFKSFVALDWGLCLATGAPWQGKAVERVKVLYIAAEGAHGIAQRVRAWEAAHDIKVDPDWFVVRRSAVNVFRARDDYAHLLDHIERGGYGLVIVDTLRRVSGGANGNDTDMGVVVDNLDRIKRATANGSVLAVAHTDKGDNDTRGFSGIEDDADTVWSAKREADTNEVILRCEKFKDGPDGHRFALAMRNEADSLVVEGQTASRSPFGDETVAAQRLMATMRETFSNNVKGASVPDLIVMTGLSRATVYRWRTTEIQRGRIREDARGNLHLVARQEAIDG
ncbi:helicase RepA family protein [Mycobacterium sp. SMC-8]|uniref:AAA family ATPase n=1 Tax=Mycobacterium sp. SMC-8 TaxID=2857060 RepID=UPI0021B33D27|nr:helicase RepA family protein [Mycobacterium sp. SMC-8]UXA09991.1 helicase RepA family protein [Mycobacterium sp. SMC-8]